MFIHLLTVVLNRISMISVSITGTVRERHVAW